jgi:hypothetical protein
MKLRTKTLLCTGLPLVLLIALVAWLLLRQLYATRIELGQQRLLDQVAKVATRLSAKNEYANRIARVMALAQEQGIADRGALKAAEQSIEPEQQAQRQAQQGQQALETAPVIGRWGLAAHGRRGWTQRWSQRFSWQTPQNRSNTVRGQQQPDRVASACVGPSWAEQLQC